MSHWWWGGTSVDSEVTEWIMDPLWFGPLWDLPGRPGEGRWG